MAKDHLRLGKDRQFYVDPTTGFKLKAGDPPKKPDFVSGEMRSRIEGGHLVRCEGSTQDAPKESAKNTAGSEIADGMRTTDITLETLDIPAPEKLAKMKRDELREIAKRLDISYKVTDSSKKLIQAILAAQ